MASVLTITAVHHLAAQAEAQVLEIVTTLDPLQQKIIHQVGLITEMPEETHHQAITQVVAAEVPVVQDKITLVLLKEIVLVLEVLV